MIQALLHLKKFLFSCEIDKKESGKLEVLRIFKAGFFLKFSIQNYFVTITIMRYYNKTASTAKNQPAGLRSFS